MKLSTLAASAILALSSLCSAQWTYWRGVLERPSGSSTDLLCYGYTQGNPSSPVTAGLDSSAPHRHVYLPWASWSIVLADFGGPLLATPLRVAGYDVWIDPAQVWALGIATGAMEFVQLPIPPAVLRTQPITLHIQGIAFFPSGRIADITPAYSVGWPSIL